MKLNDALNMMEDLKKKFNLDDWVVGFNYSKRRFGVCDGKKKRIELAYMLILLNEESDVKNTILHEIAHALVGVENHHNHIWKNKAIEIGCSGDRTYKSHIKTPVGNFKLQCPACKKVYERYRKTNGTHSCGICSNKYDEKFRLV